MTLVQLQYVLAVAEQKNFTQAAEKSFVTQPTLSMQIQKLENELDVEIFDRSTHPIKITAIGERIIAQAKEILREAKRMQQLVDEQRTSLTGEFTVGVIPTILPSLAPLFYKTFAKKYPKARLLIREMKTEDIIKSLGEGMLDFGIAATPLGENHIVETPLYYEPLVAYVPPNHPLSKEKHVNMDNIKESDILILQEGHCFRNNVLSLCEAIDKKEMPVFDVQSSSFDALMKFADEGFGITVLPSLYSEELPDAKGANLRTFEEPIPTREVSLVYHKSQLRIKFIEEFSNLIKSILRGKIFLENNQKLTLPAVSLA